MTPAKAARIRAERIEGKAPSNQVRREEEQAAKIAEAGRWTFTRLWAEYAAQKTPGPALRTDQSRFEKYIKPIFGEKEPAEVLTLDLDRLRSRLLKQGKAPQTVKHVLALFKRLERFGVRKGLCDAPDARKQTICMSLQFIARDGEKRFLTGGQMQGGFFPIAATNGEKDDLLHIAEGFATAAAIHAATDAAVLVAFTAGNLLPVAEMARGQYPDRAIIICADDDASTAGNPGLTKATEAALAIKARLAIPRFTDPTKGTDFNDLAAAEGLETVKACLAAAEAPEPEAASAVCPPEPLRRALPTPGPFPLDALGDVLGGAAQAMDFRSPHPLPACYVLFRLCYASWPPMSGDSPGGPRPENQTSLPKLTVIGTFTHAKRKTEGQVTPLVNPFPRKDQ